MTDHLGLHKKASGLTSDQIGKGGTFWFCRHAEVHNPKEVYYGRLPRFGLTANGHSQAAQLGTFLAQEPLKALYVSPMLRARQTAKAIQAVQPELKPRLEKRIIEVHSSYDGTPLSQISDFNFYEPPAHPDDETIEDVRNRVLDFLKEALAKPQGRMFAAISHGDPVVILHAFYMGLPMKLASLRSPNFYPERASVTRYDFPPEGFTLEISRVQVSYYEPPFKLEED